MAKLKTVKKPNSGCSYVLLIGFVAILLFVFNIFLVRSLFSAVPVLEDQRIKQFFEFVLPVGLIFIEYWIYDLITDLLDRRIK